MNALQQFVSERLAKLGLSTRQAAARTVGLDRRPRISHSSINNITRGAHAHVRFQPKTVQALADALDVPPSRIKRAIRESEGTRPAKFTLPRPLANLNETNRRAVVAYAERLLARQLADSRAIAPLQERRSTATR